MTARARPTSAFARARAAFAAAPRPAGAKISNRAKVRAMLDDIRAKRAAGWSYAEIRTVLMETQGFTGTLASLYSYVSKLSRPQHNLPETQPAPASATEPEAPGRPRRIADLCGHFAYPDPEASRGTKKRKRSLVNTLNKPV